MTSAYHPQSNGLVERLNQTVQNVLLKLVNDHQNNWDELLDPALFAIRTSRQKSTKYTPFETMFNRCINIKYITHTKFSYVTYDIPSVTKLLAELEITPSIFESHNPEEEECEKALDDKMQKMIAVHEKMFMDAASNIKDAQAQYKKDYDKKRCNNEVVLPF